MAHGNDIIHNNHYRKHWQRLVRTWFNQPGRKLRRQNARKEKAAKIAPRPVHGPIRPIVNCPTFRYNMKVREGRGFSLLELQKAGINKKYARTIGIAVDHRRKNASKRNLNRNVNRLKAYQSKLVVLPVHKKSEAKKLLQLKEPFMPVYQPKPRMQSHVITEDEKSYQAFHSMRQLRAQKQLIGKRIRLRTVKED